METVPPLSDIKLHNFLCSVYILPVIVVENAYSFFYVCSSAFRSWHAAFHRVNLSLEESVSHPFMELGLCHCCASGLWSKAGREPGPGPAADTLPNSVLWDS